MAEQSLPEALLAFLSPKTLYEPAESFLNLISDSIFVKRAVRTWWDQELSVLVQARYKTRQEQE
jgi:hypothetical protein